MEDTFNFKRFLLKQEEVYFIALNELKVGKKQSHWMWYIFPQLKALGRSYNADYYGIQDLTEATAYLANNTLRERLEEISNALLEIIDNDALKIMGNPDHHKLKSCMTLFSLVPGSNPIFIKLLNKFFEGKTCIRTIQIIQQTEHKSGFINL